MNDRPAAASRNRGRYDGRPPKEDDMIDLQSHRDDPGAGPVGRGTRT
jgi:hypothetical protein